MVTVAENSAKTAQKRVTALFFVCGFFRLCEKIYTKLLTIGYLIDFLHFNMYNKIS